MDSFLMYLQLGIEHISDLEAYDHMLFIISLCALYILAQWKEVLILVTAFTVGHSITLILSILNLVNIPSNIIETLIPITILITALFNLLEKKPNLGLGWFNFHYLIALLFGLIHGMGFANYLKSLLGSSDKTLPLFAFNVGIEIGQIGIVIFYFLLYFLLSKIFNFKHRSWVLFVSGGIVALSLTMIFGG